MDKSTPDLWELVSAIHLHGPNVDTLQTALPNWTKDNIIIVLKKYKNMAQRERNFIAEGRKVIQYPGSQKLTWTPESQDKLPFGGSDGSGRGGVGCSKANYSRSRGTASPALLSWGQLVRSVQIVQGSSDHGIALPKRRKKLLVCDHSQLISKVRKSHYWPIHGYVYVCYHTSISSPLFFWSYHFIC